MSHQTITADDLRVDDLIRHNGQTHIVTAINDGDEAVTYVDLETVDGNVGHAYTVLFTESDQITRVQS